MRATMMLTLALALLWAPARAETKPLQIKIATLAPRGSAWMRIFNKLKATVTKQSEGRVTLRIYPGGVQGDERDVVRKMRTGQLDGAALSGVGLAQINSEALVLQMPGMFRDYDKLDRAREALRADLEKSFEKKGFVLLGWGEIGKIYLFSRHPVRSIAEMRKRRVWAWADDPVGRAMMRKLKVSPRPLSLPAVLPSLNTGMIDTVFASPLACIALQWHGSLKYISPEPLSIGIGATVLRKATYDRLDPKDRAQLRAMSSKVQRAVVKLIRRDNERAMAALQRLGIKKLPMMSATDRKKMVRAAIEVTQSFVPRYFPQAMLDKVIKARGVTKAERAEWAAAMK